MVRRVLLKVVIESDSVCLCMSGSEATRLEVFGEFRPEDYAGEAEQRWGDTEAYRQSQRRVATYNKEDWQRIKAEEEQVRARLAAAFASGSAPDSEEAMAAAEAHRQHISLWFRSEEHTSELQ